MSQQAAITLNTVVYNPAGSNKGIVRWADRSGGVLNSFSYLTQGFVVNSGARKLTKATFRLEVPVVATASSTCSCEGELLRSSSAQIDFWIAPDASAAERADLLARVTDLISSTAVSDAVSDLNPVYA